MAAGYLNLQQRALRDTVIHPFASAAELATYPGAEGQIASTEGSFYIFTAGAWQRIVHQADLTVLLSQLAAVFTTTIDDGTISPVSINHGFPERPVVEVTGPDGAVIEVSVVHSLQSCTISWQNVLPVPAVVTCVGSKSLVK